MDNSILFNCCTEAKEPDWSRFSNLELGGCIDDDGYTIGGIIREEAEFFTVYGRLKGDVCEAITDWHGSFDEAVCTAEELARLSGLPLEVCC
ncbi:hypothetical protein HFN99_01030 [Rhizobium laguerreae]|uniref:hypothetical protein n=1 Tax=Rhizobium laguerreae TaxID=1076926 RepID=UPI001C90300D|nr:hypothetical protein [Rhizobium laguerreae]MBY3335516.1 hypothetical protein [Rhizobium laguerreae]